MIRGLFLTSRRPAFAALWLGVHDRYVETGFLGVQGSEDWSTEFWNRMGRMVRIFFRVQVDCYYWQGCEVYHAVRVAKGMGFEGFFMWSSM